MITIYNKLMTSSTVQVLYLEQIFYNINVNYQHSSFYESIKVYDYIFHHHTTFGIRSCLVLNNIPS